MIQFIVIYIFIINVFTFAIWGIDKRKAVHQKRRIREKDLLYLTAAGGCIGAIAGMTFFRHKTIKSKFLYRFWGVTITWIVILIILLFLQ